MQITFHLGIQLKEKMNRAEYNMCVDDHWINLSEPLIPSIDDVEIYHNHIIGSKILLLGCTQRLLDLATEAIDIDPKYNLPKIRKCDWLDYETFTDTVLIDGCFNFNKELADNLLTHYSTKCMRIISRTFSYKLPKMKYATHFPTKYDFNIQPQIIGEFNDYRFYMWDFK